MRLKLFLLLLLTVVFPSLAQTTGVSGTVVDSNTGAPVSGATVMLDNQGLYATTDPSGDFRISNAKAGDDLLVIVAYGYQDVNMNVVIANGVIDNLGVIKMLDTDLNNVFYEEQNDMLFDQNLLDDLRVRATMSTTTRPTMISSPCVFVSVVMIRSIPRHTSTVSASTILPVAVSIIRPWEA